MKIICTQEVQKSHNGFQWNPAVPGGLANNRELTLELACDLMEFMEAMILFLCPNLDMWKTWNVEERNLLEC